LKRPGDEIVDNYPQLVHFRDVRDPKSVAAVDPAHLDAAFGPGVRLKRITVQVTGDPVTRGIEGRLPKPPYIRSFVYDGEESEQLNLHKGKTVSEVVDVEKFMQGTGK
jgi:hypothetical protein